MLISKYLRSLSNEELADLTEVVFHKALSEEVTRRFKKQYEEMAYAYYNSEDYAIIGNITELGVEDHSIILYQELASELVSHIRTLL
mgnify:FL=1